ncbi:hypothetical protein D3C83_22710 [compost metagenome]
MQRRTGETAGDKCGDAPHSAPDQCEEKSRGDDERCVVEADQRVSQARQQALRERLRQAPVHEVMRPRSAGQRRERGNGGCSYRFLHGIDSGSGESNVNILL